jgi:hypothetical protein
MNDDTSHISDLDMKPTYQASITLRSGCTAREIASMMHAADRAASRGH